MPDRHGHARQRRTPPTIRHPRVPAGQRIVREQGWLSTDHPDARWFHLAAHSADWSQVRLEVAGSPGAAAGALDVIVRPDGYVVPQRADPPLGAEAIRIIATVIRAGQRVADS